MNIKIVMYSIQSVERVLIIGIHFPVFNVQTNCKWGGYFNVEGILFLSV